MFRTGCDNAVTPAYRCARDNSMIEFALHAVSGRHILT
jgi:hypothetical protein